MIKPKYSKRDFRNINGKDTTPYCYGCKYFYKKTCLKTMKVGDELKLTVECLFKQGDKNLQAKL